MQKKTGPVIRQALSMLLFCLFHFQTAYALDVNGLISTDSHWSIADSPINITGNLRVEANATLTIDPGVKVVFTSSPDSAQGYSIRIDGTLVARGDQMEPIVFTAADPSVPWGSVMFDDTSTDWNQEASSGSAIEYCVIEYGGNQADGGAMISTFDAMPLIRNNAIRFSIAAGISALASDDPAQISSLSGNIRIMSNLIYNNATGILILSEGGIIKNNYFLNNTRAIDLQTRSNDVTIQNNTVISTAPELLGAGLRLILDEAASGITAYQWRQTAGTPVTLSHPNSARTTFTAIDPGSNVEKLSFELTVTDEEGLQSTETVVITITGDNPPPVARAGGGGNVQLPQEEGEVLTITLSGAGSSDPYLGIAAYEWEQTEGTAVSLENADTISPSFIVPETISAGDRMTFQLTVTDQGGLSSTDSTALIYYDDNIFPVAAAGDDRRVIQGETVFLNGAGSSDTDGSIVSYSWVQTEGPQVELVNPNSATPFFETPTDNTTAETFIFRLRVTDNGGLQDVDDISVTVYGSLIAAISASTAAGDRVILDGSASVDLNATAAIAIENNILETGNPDAGLFALTAEANTVFTLNATGNHFTSIDNKSYIIYTYNWSETAPAVIDMPDNWWGTSDAAIIEELIYDQKNDYQLPELNFRPFEGQAPPDGGSSLPYPPLADAGPDLEIAADNSVTLDGTDSYDPNGIARYQWSQTDGIQVDLKNADQPTANFIAPSGGPDGDALRFALTVSTGDTFSHTDTVDVAISPDESMPEVNVDGCFIASAASSDVIGACTSRWAALLLAGVVSGILFLSPLRRRFLILVCFLTATFFLPPLPAQAGYFAAGGGAGSDADEVNVTLETGAKDIYFNKLNMLFGVGIHLIPHSDNDLPSPTISRPCPNDACIPMENARKGTEVGFSGKIGIEIGSSNVYISAIGGFTAYTESELSRSPATGRVYEESSDSKIEGLYGGGLSYFMDYKWDIVFQVDYDNIRGVTGTIGWHW